MSEQIVVTLGGDGTRRFDEVVHSGLSEGGDLELAVKRNGTVSGKPAVVVTFTVLIDGVPMRAQAVTTLRALVEAVRIVGAAYDGYL